MRIISLSTIPPRFSTLMPTLSSLLEQRASIDQIRLYIPKYYRRFPEYDGSVPDVPEGVTIVRTEHDLGPASKVLFAAQDFKGVDAQILFCDDDKLFSPTWSGDLFKAQASRPNECVALIGKVMPDAWGKTGHLGPKAIRTGKTDYILRARRLAHRLLSPSSGSQRPRPMRKAIAKGGYADIFQGFGGVVIRPDFFSAAAYDIPDVLWAVDDVWLSGNLASENIPIWLPAGIAEPDMTAANDIESLLNATLDGFGRSEANRQCVSYMQKHYKIWI